MSPSPTVKMEALSHLIPQPWSWSLLWACPVSLKEVGHLKVNFMSDGTIIQTALPLITDGIILTNLRSNLLWAFWSWMKASNIIVSVPMANAGTLTRLSGGGTLLQCPACTRIFISIASTLALGLTQPPSQWVLGDLFLVVCNRGTNLTALPRTYLHHY
jgi:hypothetical protein